MLGFCVRFFEKSREVDIEEAVQYIPDKSVDLLAVTPKRKQAHAGIWPER
jgi:hypothetical protein